MSTYYIDSSVIVALMFEESESQKMRGWLNKADELVSANLLEAEVFSAGFREKITKNEIMSFVDKVSLFFPPDSLERELDEVLRLSYIRGADAYHLSAALRLDPKRKKLIFLTHDHKQRLSAEKLGFKTSPKV